MRACDELIDPDCTNLGQIKKTIDHPRLGIFPWTQSSKSGEVDLKFLLNSDKGSDINKTVY